MHLTSLPSTFWQHSQSGWLDVPHCSSSRLWQECSQEWLPYRHVWCSPSTSLREAPQRGWLPSLDCRAFLNMVAVLCGPKVHNACWKNRAKQRTCQLRLYVVKQVVSTLYRVPWNLREYLKKILQCVSSKRALWTSSAMYCLLSLRL